MTKKISFITIIGVAAFALLFFTSFNIMPVTAQGTPPPEECQCRQCHEQRYYLYDTGKWYCLCKSPMTCVHCHGGNGAETNADQAHQDLLANPFADDAAVCRNCHKEESQARVDAFIARAGVMPTPVIMTYQPTFRSAEPYPFPESAPRVFGFWEWFSVILVSGILVRLFIAWRR
jgi:hypothetical protein